MFKRQPIIATAFVCAIYVASLCVVAFEAHLLMVFAFNDASEIPSGILVLVALLVVPIAIGSGLIPVRVLRFFNISSRIAYVGNAIMSALLGIYALAYVFGVMDNMGAIINYVPKNGRDLSDGWTKGVPPFSKTLWYTFHSIPVLLRDGQVIEGCALLALIAGVIALMVFPRRGTTTGQPPA
jgi:hypothetical protein